MAIEVQRVFVREGGGQLAHKTPSKFTYDVVVEATADVAGDSYIATFAVADFTAPGTPVPGALIPGPLLVPAVGAPQWLQPFAGARWEIRWSNTIGPLGAADKTAMTDHLLKYYVILRNTTGGKTDADGAESDIFMLFG